MALSCQPVPAESLVRALSSRESIPSDAYALPGDPSRDAYVIPLSGGADSTALAIVMASLFPGFPFLYLFTDTLAEEPEIYSTLDALEQFLGVHIERLVPPNGLMDLIRSYGGFLPGVKSRYCTRELKIRPFEAYIARLRESRAVVHTFVGVRADEDRVGLVSRDDGIEQHMPLKTLGIRREHVFRILDRSGVGIPSFYLGRTRSGCYCCPFMSARELVATAQRQPHLFALAQAIERDKLSPSDIHRWPDNAPHLGQETGFGRNHLHLPIPARVDLRTRDDARAFTWNPSRRAPPASRDLFGFDDQVEVFVLGEFLLHPGCGDHGVWYQNLVSWSRSRAGIVRQADHHYWHRISTPEIFGVDAQAFASEYAMAIYRLLLPAALVDPGPPGPGSYTWKSGLSYSQLVHVTAWCERTLNLEGLRQEFADYRDATHGWRAESRAAIEAALDAVDGPVGELVGMDRIEPSALAPPEEDESEVPCFACSI